jgi:hypothetical protein
MIRERTKSILLATRMTVGGGSIWNGDVRLLLLFDDWAGSSTGKLIVL